MEIEKNVYYAFKEDLVKGIKILHITMIPKPFGNLS